MALSKKITGSHLIAKAIQMEGVTNIFTLAGDHVLPVLDVMSQQDFRFIDTRHEQAAVHMADAWGRITGQPGVAIYTTPGFANAIPGLSSAMHAESPLLSISGCAESNELGRGAMQEIDQVGMAKPTTKGAWMVTDVRRIPDMIAKALRLAYTGRRGPVHLTIPVDIQQEELFEDEVKFYEPAEYRRTSPSLAGVAQIENAIGLLRNSKKPLIIAGSAASYAESGEVLQKFIETCRIPLMTEGDARGMVSDDHPYCVGFFDSGLNHAARMMKQADTIVLLGRAQDLIMGYAMPPNVSADAKIIQIDPSEAEIGRNKGVSVGVVGDIEAVVSQLTECASKYVWSDLPWTRQLADARKRQLDELETLSKEEVPMHATYVHKVLNQQLKPDDYVVFDGGDFCHFGRAYIPALTKRSWWYLPPLGMLGSSLPTAMAAKLAHPKRRVFMITGDGAFGFNGLEFDTAVRHNLDIVAILGNDSAWGIDRQIQIGVFGKPVATDLLPTRYDQVVRALGGHGEHVENPQELPSAIERSININRPALINVQVQRAISPRAEAAIDRWKSDSPLPM